MYQISFDSILLFTLVIPFIMGYRISPFDTQYWLFGFIFLGLFIYIALDLFLAKSRFYQLGKNIILWFTIVIVIGSSFTAAVHNRHKTHPIYQVHDIILQQEAAIRYLLDGKNPYATNYFGTFVEQWHYSDKETNPALYHFVMEPFYLIFSLPFYYISNHTLGFFDGRIPLHFLFFLLLITAFALVKDQDKRRIFLILLSFHPAMLPYTLEGRSDIFMYAFLFFGFYLLYKKRLGLSGIPIGLAFAVKQSSWPLFPFYVAFFYLNTKSIRKTIILMIPFTLVFGAFVLPFYFWDRSAFLDSTIGFLNGTVDHSYPISGYGLGRVLLEFNIIKDKFVFYPFHLWQIFIGTIILAVSILYLKKHKNVRSLILIYGIFLFVYWYFSRYFNNSHLAFISMVLVTAYFWPEEEKVIHSIKEKEEKKSIQPRSQRRRFLKK